MKKRKYLQRLAALVLLGVIVPAVLAFNIFLGYSLKQWVHSNEDVYDSLLNTYVTLLDKKIQDLETFAAKISARSRSHDSVLSVGGDSFADDPFEVYQAVRELNERYENNYVTEWGIYFYDSDRIITPRYSYTPENFIYKYTGKSMEEAACADFFSDTRYSKREMIFASTDPEEINKGYLMLGSCTRIGQTADPALIFWILSPEDISKSLMVVGGEGITYYLKNQEKGDVLLSWGDAPGEDAGQILSLDSWEERSGVKQKVKYDIQSAYPQLSITAYISENSFQDHIIDWFGSMKLILVVMMVVLILIGLGILYISYKPIYELTNELDYEGGSEFDIIRHRLGDQVARINEQHMLILDLLIEHLIHGVPISMKQMTQLGIVEGMKYYCVFLLEGYSYLNSEVEKLTTDIESKLRLRMFVTDWREENSSIVIAFLKDEDISGLQEKLELWLREQRGEQCTLYTGKVYDKLENIQLSFRSCIEQMKKKNGRKQKEKLDANTLSPKKEQQKKLLEEILAYLEDNYRDSNLSQIQVADLFHMSNYTLSRLFKNQVGVGFSEYLAAKRLEHAKELLLTTSYPVKEVAAMSGFANENYFSRTFKLYEGISPSNFRSR